MATSTSPPHAQKQKESYYEILNLDPKCTLQDIKKAYYSLALKYHPDKSPHFVTESSSPPTTTPTVPRDFHEIHQAYTVLSDPTKRKEYDALLHLNILNEREIISEEVDLDDMYQEDCVWKHDCRCGGWYIVTEDELVNGTTVFGCDMCSLRIRVNYTACVD